MSVAQVPNCICLNQLASAEYIAGPAKSKVIGVHTRDRQVAQRFFRMIGERDSDI